VDGNTTKYCYDGDQVIAEYDGNDTLLRKFVYGPGIDEPICMIDVADSNAIYYYHFDGLGSVAALSDVNNVVVERYSYDVFGEPNITSSVGNPYMFTGRRLDTETHLYYYRARYYAYDIGRFLQTDPIGYYYSMNLYEYCLNNPINYIDSYGLLGVGLGGSGTGGVFPGGATGGGQLVVDRQGNIGVFSHGGGGGYYGGSGSTMIDLSVFGGTIFDLQGLFTSYGGSGGELGGIGLELNLTDSWLSSFRGSAFTFSFGGFVGLPMEVHAFREWGSVYHAGNIRDLIPSASEIGEYWKDVGHKAWNWAKDIFGGKKGS
jgi:RHS repeat-associated protein